MIVGFVTFENAEQLQSGVEVCFVLRLFYFEMYQRMLYRNVFNVLQILDGKTVNSSNLKIADVLPRTFDKNDARKSVKSARDAVTPLAYLSYADQLEQKKTSIGQMLKKLVRSFVFLFELVFIYVSQLQQTDLFWKYGRRGMRVKLVQMGIHFHNGSLHRETEVRKVYIVDDRITLLSCWLV